MNTILKIGKCKALIALLVLLCTGCRGEWFKTSYTHVVYIVNDSGHLMVIERNFPGYSSPQHQSTPEVYKGIEVSGNIYPSDWVLQRCSSEDGIWGYSLHPGEVGLLFILDQDTNSYPDCLSDMKRMYPEARIIVRENIGGEVITEIGLDDLSVSYTENRKDTERSHYDFYYYVRLSVWLKEKDLR